MRKIKNILAFIAVLMVYSLGAVSCDNSDNPESPYVDNSGNDDGEKDMAILLYAIASNNLEYNLKSDKNEILACAPDLDLKRNSIYIYEVTNSYEPVLLKLVKENADTYSYKTIKEYDAEISSASPSRISEVINDFSKLVDSEKYGLILWSHGTGADYYREPQSQNNITLPLPEDGSFGYDKNPETGIITQINIDRLADAIPSGFFNYIWFDACYMGGIETIYELRDKCDYYVGYPTEVFEWGLAYDQVMPYILKSNPDLIGGAEAFFNYYAEHPISAARVATVAVVDMSKLEEVASLCKTAYAAGESAKTYDLQRYTRGSIGPFYDVNGFTRQQADFSNLDEGWFDNWQRALDSLLLFKATTAYDFNGYPIDKEQFCGISCYIPTVTSETAKETFYRRLDWFKRVYPEIEE